MFADVLKLLADLKRVVKDLLKASNPNSGKKMQESSG